jgi:hypothetical protein
VRRAARRCSRRPVHPHARRVSGDLSDQKRRADAVFVDESGCRARRVPVAGLAVAITRSLWLAGLAKGMTGFSGFSGRLPALARKGLTASKIVRQDVVADAPEIIFRRRSPAAAETTPSADWQGAGELLHARLPLARGAPGRSSRSARHRLPESAV